MGQRLDSPRFEKKGDLRQWLELMRAARKSFASGKEITAEQRRALESARFNFGVFQGDILFEDLCARFIIHRQKAFVASTSTFNFLHIRKYLIPQFAGRNIYSIKQSEVRKFIEGLTIKEFKGYEPDAKGRPDVTKPRYEDSGKKASKSMKKAVQVTLSQVFEFAKFEELVKDDFVNPAQFVKTRGSRKANTEDERPHWKDPNDATKFLEVARFGNEKREAQPVMYAYATIGLEGGPRKAEKLGLRWSDINERDRHISIERQQEEVSLTVVDRTKSGEFVKRKIPYTEGMEEALKFWKKYSSHTKPQDYIFSREDGTPLSPRMINLWFSEICKAAEVEDITPHGLRHTFATHYLLNGGRLEDLKELLGHASIVTTEKYAHIVDAIKRAKNVIVSFFSSRDEALKVSEK